MTISRAVGKRTKKTSTKKYSQDVIGLAEMLENLGYIVVSRYGYGSKAIKKKSQRK